jgi:hypothetical protein
MERECNVAERARRELLALGHRLGRVLSLVPARRRRGFAVAALVMAMAGFAQVAVPLLLGRLIDTVQRGTEQRLPAEVLYTVAPHWPPPAPTMARVVSSCALLLSAAVA